MTIQRKPKSLTRGILPVRLYQDDLQRLFKLANEHEMLCRFETADRTCGLPGELKEAIAPAGCCRELTIDFRRADGNWSFGVTVRLGLYGGSVHAFDDRDPKVANLVEDICRFMSDRRRPFWWLFAHPGIIWGFLGGLLVLSMMASKLLADSFLPLWRRSPGTAVASAVSLGLLTVALVCLWLFLDRRSFYLIAPGENRPSGGVFKRLGNNKAAVAIVPAVVTYILGVLTTKISGCWGVLQDRPAAIAPGPVASQPTTATQKAQTQPGGGVKP